MGRPGKFEASGQLGEIFYELWNEGYADDECSGEHGAGAAALFRDHGDEWFSEPVLGRHAIGAVVVEDSQGFVDVVLHDREDDLREHWDAECARFGYEENPVEQPARPAGTYRLRAHTGPTDVAHYAAKVRNRPGFFNIVEGTEHVYADVLADDATTAIGHLARALFGSEDMHARRGITNLSRPRYTHENNPEPARLRQMPPHWHRDGEPPPRPRPGRLDAPRRLARMTAAERERSGREHWDPETSPRMAARPHHFAVNPESTAKTAPIANPDGVTDYFDEEAWENEQRVRESSYRHSGGLFRMWYGAYGSPLYVWADSFDSAFEVMVEWLDDNAPGALTTVGEDELREAAEELGVAWPREHDWDDRDFVRVVEAAEADLTVIGHTTLQHGTHIASYEWGGDDVTGSTEEQIVAARSFGELGDNSP